MRDQLHIADLRHYLKEATADAHARAEAAWTHKAHFHSARSYTQWLRSLLHVHAELGLLAARILGSESALLQERSRLATLRADAASGRAATRIKDPDPLPSQDWAWGVLYALNGSALGASVLLKNGAVRSGWPSSYLILMRSYATSGGLAAFFRHLSEIDIDPDEARQGACAVFDRLSDFAELRVPVRPDPA